MLFSAKDYDKGLLYDYVTNFFNTLFEKEYFEDDYEREDFQENHFLTRLVNDEKIRNNTYIVVVDNEIVDFISFYRFMGFLTLYPQFVNYNKNEDVVFDEMKKHFENYEEVVIVNTSYIDVSKYGLHFCSLVSSFCDKHYVLDSTETYSVFNPNNIYALRDVIEKKHFLDLDIDPTKFTYLLLDNDKDIRAFLDEKFGYDDSNWLFWQHSFMHSAFLGFHYFSPEYFDNKNYLFVMQDDCVLGVIKYGVYGEDEYTHYGLNYIDVNEKYRNKGVAKSLISYFATILDDKYPLVLSHTSQLGEECHIVDIFKNAAFKTKVYSYGEI